MKRHIAVFVAAGIGLQSLPAALAEPTRVITAPKTLPYHDDAWLHRKRQAQWKRERAPIGKRGRR